MHLDSKLNIQGQTVLIIGNWSYKNLGDELILLGTIQLLQQQKTLTISCYNPKRLKTFFSQFIDTSTLTFIHELPKGFTSTFQRLKKGGLRELKHFRKTDTVILGGGEILTEENPSAYRYWLAGMRPFLLKKMLKNILGNVLKNSPKCFYIMGGIQTPKSPRKQRLFRFLLSHTTHLYLRDFQAIEEIKTFYPEKKTDFFMDTSYFAYDWQSIKSSTPPGTNLLKPYIIVNLNKNGEHFLPNIINDLQIYLNKGYAIYFVPVAKGHNTYYNDLQYASLLKEKTESSDEKIQILDWENNFEYFLQILANAELVISTRLHLFLIASFLVVPTKVYPYQRKILKMQEVMKKFAKKR